MIVDRFLRQPVVSPMSNSQNLLIGARRVTTSSRCTTPKDFARDLLGKTKTAGGCRIFCWQWVNHMSKQTYCVRSFCSCFQWAIGCFLQFLWPIQPELPKTETPKTYPHFEMSNLYTPQWPRKIHKLKDLRAKGGLTNPQTPRGTHQRLFVGGFCTKENLKNFQEKTQPGGWLQRGLFTDRFLRPTGSTESHVWSGDLHSLGYQCTVDRCPRWMEFCWMGERWWNGVWENSFQGVQTDSFFLIYCFCGFRCRFEEFNRFSRFFFWMVGDSFAFCVFGIHSGCERLHQTEDHTTHPKNIQNATANNTRNCDQYHQTVDLMFLCIYKEHQEKILVTNET